MRRYVFAQLRFWLYVGVFFELLAFYFKFIGFPYIYFFGHAFPVVIISLEIAVVCFILFYIVFDSCWPMLLREINNYPREFYKTVLLLIIYIMLFFIFLLIH